MFECEPVLKKKKKTKILPYYYLWMCQDTGRIHGQNKLVRGAGNKMSCGALVTSPYFTFLDVYSVPSLLHTAA